MKTEACSNDIIECSRDDVPTTGIFGLSAFSLPVFDLSLFVC